MRLRLDCLLGRCAPGDLVCVEKLLSSPLSQIPMSGAGESVAGRLTLPRLRLRRNVIPRREPRNLKILRPAQSGTQDDSFSLRGACPERLDLSSSTGLAEGLDKTNEA